MEKKNRKRTKPFIHSLRELINLPGALALFKSFSYAELQAFIYLALIIV
jgi:hypothetical protein